MQDNDRLYRDFKMFWRRFVKWLKSKGYGIPEYIIVVEPQERGAYHLHCIWMWGEAAPYIPNDELKTLWGQGFVQIKAVDRCDNLGAYLSAYLGDIQTDGQEGQDKKHIKGGRLKYYKKGMRIYRVSKGIKYPDVEVTDGYTLRDSEVSMGKLTYETSYIISDGDRIVNKVTRSYYNRLK